MFWVSLHINCWTCSWVLVQMIAFLQNSWSSFHVNVSYGFQKTKSMIPVLILRNQLMSMYSLIPKWLEAECHIITDSQLLIWIQIKLFWVSVQMNCSFTEQLQLIPCQCFLWFLKDLWFLLIAKQLLINHSFLYSENNWLDSPWNYIQVSVHMSCCFKD